MSRFLACTLSLLLALPAFAQTPVGDAALLQRMQADLALQLQETQRMLGLVGPNDRQLADMLRTQQQDLTRQLRDVMLQLQGPGTGMADLDDIPAIPQGRVRNDDMSPMPFDPRIQRPIPQIPVQSQVPQQLLNAISGAGIDVTAFPPATPYFNPPMTPPIPNDLPSWGPRPPRELIEMKQSIDMLQREVGELRETIKALETQIQLLSRNILLLDRVRDSTPL